MPDDRPKRAPTHDDRRDRRQTPSSGAPIRVVDPPPVPGRTPTPQDVLSRRVAALEAELKDNTRSTVRMEALLESFLAPLVKEQSAKLDTCLHHIATSQHLTAAVVELRESVENVGVRVGEIRTEQRIGAERLEAHEQRDQERHEETVAALRGHAQRLDALEQAKTVADTTAKVKKLVAVPRWWKASWVKAIGLAVAGAITAGAAYYFGG